MTVFRVEKNRSYTVMSNRHLQDRRLTLKAKGLLSQMLSLPEDWDYTLKGLAGINRESVDAIRSAVKELEETGYVERRQARDARGKMGPMEYIIRECPVSGNPAAEIPALESPKQEKNYRNKEYRDREPILSVADSAGLPSEVEIRDRIEFSCLAKRHPGDVDVLEGIVALIAETETEAMDRRTIRIAGGDYPAAMVKERFGRIGSGHVEYVLECLHKGTSEVRNIKQYMLAMLFNAPATIGGYYTAQASHDLRSGNNFMKV